MKTILHGLAILFCSASLLACSSATGDGDVGGAGDGSLSHDETSPSGDDGGGGPTDSAPFSPPADACEGPLGAPIDPGSLPKCCADHPGRAHCVDSTKIPSAMSSLVAKCDDASKACVPDDFIKTGGVFEPKHCTAFGAEGRCMSLCIPQVAEKSGILKQDVCDNEDEVCVPCINPLDKTPTRVCELKGVCKGDDAGPIGSDDAAPVDSGPPVCPHVGPPVIDPATFKACQCADAHCVPGSAVPAAEASKLAACDADPAGKCVPDVLIASGGDFIAPTCASVNGQEGRCLSTCLPEVAAKAPHLPQSTCGASEKCVPCYDPLTLKETGACRQSCDPGPSAGPPPPPPTCCSGHGTCLAPSIIGGSASSLQQDKCPKADVCVPNAFLDKTWTHVDCAASTLLGSAGPGVCMPDCVKGMSWLLMKGTCTEPGYKCAPCKDPLSGKSTGACEFVLPP